MAELLTIQDSIDGRLDTQTLKEAVNEDKMITARLGREYASVPMASRLFVESGLLGATPYSTFAKMTTEGAESVDGSYAVVTNEPIINNIDKNGFYQKADGAWVFLEWNPIVQSKLYTDTALADVSLESQAVDADKLLTFTDDDYNILASIDSELTANFDGVKTDRLETAQMQWYESNLTDNPLTFTDDSGNILCYLDLNGELQSISKNSNSLLKPITRSFTDIIHVAIYGQSLSLGLGATVVSTTNEAINALVPNAGIEDGQQGSAKQGIDALPLSSTALVAFDPALNPNLKESPIYAATIHLQKSLDIRDISSKILASAHGYGATAIAGLSKGTINYNVGMAQSKRYREYASARGDSCLTQFVLWVQGEADISNGLSGVAYKTALTKLISDYQNDINQPALKPIMLSYQVSSHTKRTPNSSPEIAYAQLQLANENPYFKVACATYPMHYYDGVHMIADSYRWLGAYFGKVMEWMLTNKRTDWQPLQPSSIIRTGKVVTVYFDVPVGPLVFDTSMVTNPGDYGFIVKDSSGAVLPISSVSIKDGDRVNIILATDPTSSVTVTYALGTTGADAGYSTGARGNLRDSDDTLSNVLDNTGTPYTLYNWCVLFSQKENFQWAQ